MKTYKTIQKQSSDEFVERKSKFIGHVSPVCSEQEVTDFIAKIKAEHLQATHNCWAYILRENNIQRYNDDGEPQGTAGIPILEVLKKEEIVNVAVVVTRYYGGIQLGAGGLIRAYSQGAKIALDAGVRVTMARCFIVDILLPYSIYDIFLASTAEYPMITINTEYGEKITVTLRLRCDFFEILQEALKEISSGTVEPVITGEEFAPI